MDRQTLQKQFEEGNAPPALNGFYKGRLLLLLPQTPREHIAHFLSNFFVPWKGKCFYKASQTGDNILPNYTKSLLAIYPEKIRFGKSEFGGFHAFTFKTSLDKGLVDRVKTLRLSYDLSENPKQIQTVVDELVEQEKDIYLGKAYLKEEESYRLLAFFQLRSS